MQCGFNIFLIFLYYHAPNIRWPPYILADFKIYGNVFPICKQIVISNYNMG